MNDVETIIRRTHEMANKRGLNLGSSKVSKLVRRYVRAGGNAASFADEVTPRERIVLADIDAIAREMRRPVKVFNAGLPGLGKR